MKRWIFPVLLVGLGVTMAGTVVVRWHKLELQRQERAGLREQARELSRLRDAHAKLQARKLSPADEEVLRREHQTLVRLRAELEQLQRGSPGP